VLLPTADARRCKRLLHPRLEDDRTVNPATFGPAARLWLALDFDSLEPPEPLAWPRWLEKPRLTAAFIAGLLPGEFRGASCILQATASAGVKPGIRARIWYWLERHVDDAEAARWLADAPVDRSLFRPVQPIYTATPMFRDCRDPLPRRLWLVRGERLNVPLPELPEPPRAAVMPMQPPARRGGCTYAHAALRRAVERVACAGEGERNERLNAEAFSLARLAASGELDREELFLSLAAAAETAGLTRWEIVATLRSALRAGEARHG
jgi:hypothetical protein